MSGYLYVSYWQINLDINVKNDVWLFLEYQDFTRSRF